MRGPDFDLGAELDSSEFIIPAEEVYADGKRMKRDYY